MSWPNDLCTVILDDGMFADDINCINHFPRAKARARFAGPQETVDLSPLVRFQLFLRVFELIL